jgi:hypothetical protein
MYQYDEIFLLLKVIKEDNLQMVRLNVYNNLCKNIHTKPRMEAKNQLPAISTTYDGSRFII